MKYIYIVFSATPYKMSSFIRHMLNNRYNHVALSFEEDLSEHRNKKLDDDFVMFCIDINGLKMVNDTKGHAAGDELIKGAADCLVLSIGQAGKTYRTGGDEFMAIVHSKAPESVREDIHKRSGEWHGAHSDELSVAVGYASTADHRDATIDDLEHMADADMYIEKEKYYQRAKIDRRRSR